MVSKKQKALTIMPDEVSFIITKTGQILCVDKENKLICVNEQSSIQLPDIDTMRQLLNAGDTFNNPGGLYFETTKKILEKYRFFSMTKGKKLEIQQGFKDDMDIASMSDGDPIKLTVYENDDISEWMRLLATRSSSYPRRLATFVSKSQNVILSYSIEKIVRAGVEMMQESSSEQYREYGEILYARYIHPDYAGENIDFFIKCSKKKKTAYFAALNKSIASLSSFLFGAFPGDQCLLVAEFDDDIVQVKVNS